MEIVPSSFAPPLRHSPSRHPSPPPSAAPPIFGAQRQAASSPFLQEDNPPTPRWASPTKRLYDLIRDGWRRLEAWLFPKIPLLEPLASVQKDLFSPRPAQTPGLQRFAVVGDAGSANHKQNAVAQWMTDAYAKNPFATVLVLGDNVYENGEPWKFHQAIDKPYRELFQYGVRFYPVLGNHDVRGRLTQKGSLQLHHWGLPKDTRYYTFTLGQQPDGKPQVAFFGLDTTVFLPGYDGCYRSKEDAAWATAQAEKQLQWLEESLKTSPAKFKIVYGHYPMYSSGMHGLRRDVTLKLRRLLEPLLVQGGADLYLAGHEHHYERSHPIHDVQHIVSGGGSRRRRVYYTQSIYPRARLAAKYHFMVFDIQPETLRFTVYSREGKEIDSGEILPRRPGAEKIPHEAGVRFHAKR